MKRRSWLGPPGAASVGAIANGEAGTGASSASAADNSSATKLFGLLARNGKGNVDGVSTMAAGGEGCASCLIIDFSKEEVKKVASGFYSNHKMQLDVPLRGTPGERRKLIMDVPDHVLVDNIFCFFSQAYLVRSLSVVSRAIRGYVQKFYKVQISIEGKTINDINIPETDFIPRTRWRFNSLKICTQDDDELSVPKEMIQRLESLRLETLSLEGTPFVGSELQRCKTIKTLKVRHSSAFVSTDKLPSSLEKIYIDGAYRLADISKLPSGLKEFHSYHAKYIGDVSTLPPNVHTLNLSYCQAIEDISKLPIRVKKLDLSWCSKFTHLRGLPNSVTWLSIARNEDLSDLQGLPPNLTYLDISRNRAIRDLSGLPSTLKTLNARELYIIKEVKNLPAGLRNLSLRGCYAVERVEIPPNLFLLDLGQCYALTDISQLLKSAKNLYSLSIAECHKLHKQPMPLRYLPDSVKLLMVYEHKRRDYGEEGWDDPF